MRVMKVHEDVFLKYSPIIPNLRVLLLGNLNTYYLPKTSILVFLVLRLIWEEPIKIVS
jgi:hypothetical protein